MARWPHAAPPSVRPRVARAGAGVATGRPWRVDRSTTRRTSAVFDGASRVSATRTRSEAAQSTGIPVAATQMMQGFAGVADMI